MFHGDVLEAVVSHVPLIDLAPASHVSKEWYRAVFSSLRHLNTIKPWLFLHAPASTLAYDPRSHLWLSIVKPPSTRVSPTHMSPLHSSDSNTLYCFTPSSLSFSVDPLHLTWHHLPGPHVWRTDPIVAVVGHLVVVSGGACDFEDDALSVEIYDLNTRAWNRGKSSSMPDFFKQCGSATWLTVACNEHEMFATEKCSGVTHSFNPATGDWCGPYDLHRRNPSSSSEVFYSAVGFAGRRLMMVGLMGEVSEVKGVKIWEVKQEKAALSLKEVGEMPERMVKKLTMDGESEIESIGVCCGGDYVYVYNPRVADEVVLLEIGNGDVCKWSSVAVKIDAGTRMGKFKFTASMVGVHDIKRAIHVHNCKFNV